MSYQLHLPTDFDALAYVGAPGTNGPLGTTTFLVGILMSPILQFFWLSVRYIANKWKLPKLPYTRKCKNSNKFDF